MAPRTKTVPTFLSLKAKISSCDFSYHANQSHTYGLARRKEGELEDISFSFQNLKCSKFFRDLLRRFRNVTVEFSDI